MIWIHIMILALMLPVIVIGITACALAAAQLNKELHELRDELRGSFRPRIPAPGGASTPTHEE